MSRSLSFDELHEAIEKRAPEWQKKSGTESDPRTLSFSGLELAGEVGELCNELKKIERVRLGLAGGKEENREELMDELGDVIVCTVLVARKLGIDLGESVRAKFNKTSAKHGFSTRL